MEHGIGDQLADGKKFPFEGILVGAVFAPADKDLSYHRFGGQHTLPKPGVVYRNITPAKKVLSFRFDELQHDGFDFGPDNIIGRQKQHANRIASRFRKIELHNFTEKFIGDL